MPKNQRTRNRPVEEINWILDYYAKHGLPRQREVRDEFEKTFGKPLPQSTLSDILKRRYPKDLSILSSSELTAREASHGNDLDSGLTQQNHPDIYRAVTVGANPSAASDEPSGFGAEEQHAVLQSLLPTDSLADMQNQEPQYQGDSIQPGSMQVPHSNTPTAFHEPGLYLQKLMYGDPNSLSDPAETTEGSLPAAGGAWDLGQSPGELFTPPEEDLLSDLIASDLWQDLCDLVVPDTQPVDQEELINADSTFSQAVPSIPPQGDAIRESSAGPLLEIRSLQDPQPPTQVSPAKRRLTQTPSQQRLPLKRRRVEEGNTRDSEDISQSIDTLTSFLWTDEGALGSFAEKEARRALKGVFKDIIKRSVPHSASISNPLRSTQIS